MTRTLVIMGSGETTPTMIKPHRQLFASLRPDAKAVLLDTPYGFQLNADEISAKAVGYFAQSVGRKIDVVSWRTPPPPGLERERALTDLRTADWVFAGPGSPTYALRQWRDTELPDLLAQAEVLIFASAAALTLGSHTVPVYEIYKAGMTPSWEPGLGMFERLTGIAAVVIPHYDNAEGGHHDTRFCYLGEPRLAAMEAELPASSLIVGVDEHTALVCDLEVRTATVVGNGGLTLRQHGASTRYESGTTLSFEEFTGQPAPQRRAVAHADPVAPEHVPTSLRAVADGLHERFIAALDEQHVDECVAATLELEQSLTDWTADTLASSDTDHARGLLRGMIVQLGGLAVDVTPFVNTLLDLRTQARERKDFPASDQVRDALTDAGIEVQDTPDGPKWRQVRQDKSLT